MFVSFILLFTLARYSKPTRGRAKVSEHEMRTSSTHWYVLRSFGCHWSRKRCDLQLMAGSFKAIHPLPIKLNFCIRNNQSGDSSVGRASDWRSEGRVFDPRLTHFFLRLWVYGYMFTVALLIFARLSPLSFLFYFLRILCSHHRQQSAAFVCAYRLKWSRMRLDTWRSSRCCHSPWPQAWAAWTHTIHNGTARACYPLYAARARQHHFGISHQMASLSIIGWMPIIITQQIVDRWFRYSDTHIPYTKPPVVFQHNLSASDYRRVEMAFGGLTHTLESLFLYRLLGGFSEETPPVTWLPVDLVRPG